MATTLQTLRSLVSVGGAAVAVFFLEAAGCGTDAPETSYSACATDADCSSGLECRIEPVTQAGFCLPPESDNSDAEAADALVEDSG